MVVLEHSDIQFLLWVHAAAVLEQLLYFVLFRLAANFLNSYLHFLSSYISVPRSNDFIFLISIAHVGNFLNCFCFFFLVCQLFVGILRLDFLNLFLLWLFFLLLAVSLNFFLLLNSHIKRRQIVFSLLISLDKLKWFQLGVLSCNQVIER